MLLSSTRKYLPYRIVGRTDVLWSLTRLVGSRPCMVRTSWRSFPDRLDLTAHSNNCMVMVFTRSSACDVTERSHAAIHYHVGETETLWRHCHRKRKKERKSIYIAPFCTKVHTKRSGMDHTVLPANNTMPAFPSWAFTRWHHHNNWGSRHPIAASLFGVYIQRLKLIYVGDRATLRIVCQYSWR